MPHRSALALSALFAFISANSLVTGTAPVSATEPGESAVLSAEPNLPALTVSAGMNPFPIEFEENTGQSDPAVHFQWRSPSLNVGFASNELLFDFPKADRQPALLHDGARKLAPVVPAQSSSTPLRMRLLGGTGAATEPRARDILPGRSNYFIGNDPHRWRTNIARYHTVEYPQIAPGADFVVYGNETSQLESDFVLAPGATAENLGFEFPGADRVSITPDGELVAERGVDRLVQHRPTVYQMIDGERRIVEARFVMRGDHAAGFVLGTYDHSAELIIDPAMHIAYSTFVGGAGGGSQTTRLTVDDDGYAYFVSCTVQPNFTTTSGAYQESFRGGLIDSVVVKLDPTGKRVIFSTYVGGSDADMGVAIGIDGSRNSYITGVTSSHDYPVTSPSNHPFQPAFGGNNFDTFVTEISTDGSALVYSTYLGGSFDDTASGITVSPAGEAYVAGFTASTNFPVTIGRTAPLAYDVFVTAFQVGGEALKFSTLFGGTGTDETRDITHDESWNLYITGETYSTDFPTSSGTGGSAAQPTSHGNYDAYIAKLSADGSHLIYATYIGGSDIDYPTGIAVWNGNAFITGQTMSSDFPTVNPVQGAYGGGVSDGFVTKINANGDSIMYSTYLGGSSVDYGNGIAVDPQGSAYAVGMAFSPEFPLKNQISGSGSLFISKFNLLGDQLLFSTKLGGRSLDSASGVFADQKGNVYVSGSTGSTDFPTKNAYQDSFMGAVDFVVLKLTPASRVFLR